MNSTVKVILIILGVLLGLWVVGQAIAILQALLPVVVVLAVGYVVYRIAAKKSLPWEKRKMLP